jgi:hypothetical protein
MLFKVTDYDKKIYMNELSAYLPKRIIDIHCHVWKDSLLKGDKEKKDVKRVVTWPSLVAKDNPIEDLKETYKLMFPDKEVIPLMFATPSVFSDMDGLNSYVSAVSEQTGYPSLYFSHPDQSADELERKIREGGFLGVKSYLSFAPPYIPEGEIRIFDFFPKHQLKKLNGMGAIVMLHIPRRLRFKDPVNIAMIKEICEEFPDIKLIIAHIGRAYIPSDLGNALDELSGYKNIMYDFCANTCEYVMTELLNKTDREKILFGSDLPILRMRTRRIEENGTYINLVPPKLYGDTSVDPHLREVSEEEAKNITFFMYEEILAFKRASIKAGLTKADIENIFFNNAYSLINKASSDIYGNNFSGVK